MLDAAYGTRGNLLINPQGNLLAFILQNAEDEFDELFNGRLELFHFDSETGMVGERIVRLDETNAPFVSTNANTDSLFGGYGLAFSTDGEKLYYTQYSRLYQTNIAILDSASIQQSVVKYNEYLNPYDLSGMQLAKDGRLYISTRTNYLSVLHHPNIAGLDAGFEMLAVNLSPDYARWDLPHFDPSLFSSGFSISNRCVNTQTTFSLLYDMPYTYVYWSFGDGATSTEWEPSHLYSSIGTYVVNLTTVVGGDTTNKSMDVIIEDIPSVNLGLDSSLFCGGDTLVLDAHYYASYYTWQDSSYQSTFEVTDEGKYYVQVKNICGHVSDTITYVLDRDDVHLGVDTMICLQEPLYLLADQPSATSWLWQDGSTLPYYEAESTGDYFVFVTTPCLFIMDSIYVYTEDCSLFAPNIITPNGDGKNDSFKVINLEMLDYQWSLEIFNRWGKQVYYTTDYQNDWQGDKLSDGVYYYILRSVNTPTSYRGSVTVVR
jgi:gliding motility-associated-like protein